MTYASKAELLQAIREQRSNIDRVVAEAGDRIEQPGAMGDWSLKDVIAHLTGWRQNSVARMEAGVTGGPPNLPWHNDGDEQHDDQDDVDSINQGIYEMYRDRPVAALLADSRESFDRLEAAVSAMDDDALLTPGHFPWLGDMALGPAVITGTVEHFHDDHEAGIQAFLERA